MDTPHYDQPPIDPSLKLLQRQAAEARDAAAQVDVQQINMRALQTYGARMAATPGAVTPTPAPTMVNPDTLRGGAADLVAAALLSGINR
jgi:hypothetical protein